MGAKLYPEGTHLFRSTTGNAGPTKWPVWALFVDGGNDGFWELTDDLLQDRRRLQWDHEEDEGEEEQLPQPSGLASSSNAEPETLGDHGEGSHDPQPVIPQLFKFAGQRLAEGEIIPGLSPGTVGKGKRGNKPVPPHHRMVNPGRVPHLAPQADPDNSDREGEEELEPPQPSRQELRRRISELMDQDWSMH